MNLVWFSWKDINHPKAGGAELISWNIMKRLVGDGHSVRLITSSYSKSSDYEILNGVEIFRVGNTLTVYLRAFFAFRRHCKKWPDLVIDEMNTIPFGAAFYDKCPSVLLTYQLAREVWFFQMRWPLSYIGYWMEPLYLRLIAHKYPLVLTESQSTRADLAQFGFSKDKIGVFRVGIELNPLKKLPVKNDLSRILTLGAIRPMKRTLEAVRSFELARDQNPNLSLTIAGDDSGAYAEKVKQYIISSRHKSAIRVAGRVSKAKRLTLMQSAAVILVTSIKEGWGLIVTESNSQGTPAIVFDSDGLRDSVIDQKTGLLVPTGDVIALGKSVGGLLSNPPLYQSLREQAWKSSKQYTFENSFADFLSLTKIQH